MQLIPSIDLRGGHCVRLLRGDFAAETIYPRSPFDVAVGYRKLGARWLHVVDLDGAKTGGLAHRNQILQLVGESGLQLQVGGGVRNDVVASDLLEHGVARIVVGSAAVEQPELVTRWLERWGPARVVLALDVRLDAEGVPRVQTRGWTESTQLGLWDALAPYQRFPGLSVLCTDVACDGALEGPNLALYAEAVRRFPALCWQASGGVRHAADLAALAAAGASAAISGKAMLEQLIPHEELLPFLPSA